MTANTAKITRAIYEIVRNNGGEEHLDESAKDALFSVASFIAETLDYAGTMGILKRGRLRISSGRFDMWIKNLICFKVLEENFEREAAEAKKAAEEAEREAERKEELAALAATKDPEEF